MLLDELLQLPDEVGIATRLEVLLNSLLEAGEANLFEPADRGLGEGLGREFRKWRPSPQ